MKSFLHIIILTLLFCSCLNGQSYLDYSHKINQAELSIVDNNLKEALSFYKDAFEVSNYPQVNDISLAMQVAAELRDYKSCYEYAKELVLVGCDLNFFYKQEKYNSFRISKEWRKLLKNYGDFRHEFITNCNWTLRTRIEELGVRDQYWRVQDPNYTVLKDSTYYEDSLIMIDIYEILEDGFPNEYATGAFIENDTILEVSPTIIILLHNYNDKSTEEEGLKLTNLLRKSVLNGNLSADLFSYLNDRSGSFKIGKGFFREGPLWKFSDSIYVEKIGEKSLLEVNDNRSKIGLCSIEEQRKKAQFQLLERSYEFLKHSFINEVEMPKEMIEAFFVPVGLK